MRLLIILLVSSGMLWSVAGAAAPVPCSHVDTLGDSARNSLTAAAFAQTAEAEVEVLADASCVHELMESLHSLGATIRFADEKVGYAQILLPKTKVLELLDAPGLAAAALDNANPFADPEVRFVPVAERNPAPVPAITLPYPHVATTLPADGPYFAAGEAGLTELWRAHPEADGRGVRVAVLDGGIDLLHPALQLAKDAVGQSVPKVADVIIVSKADKDSGWVQFGEPIYAAKGTFEAAGRTWIAPHVGTFRFGLYAHKIYLNGGNSGVKEFEHSLTNIVLSVGVLWDERSDRVWVDTDGDGSFANQSSLGDFATTHSVDYFGHKSGEDDDRIPFGIKIDHAQHAAYLTISDDGHGTYVAGPLAANRVTGGLFEGAAPQAQLIDARSNANDDLTPLMLASFARSDVDVLNRSGWLGLPPADEYYDSFFHANDINAFRSLVTLRALAVYDKPVACYCGTANALHVGDYQSEEMLRRNRQLPPPYAEAVNGGVWFTPDGLVDTVLAPSTSLGTESRYMPIALRREDGRLYATDDILSPPAPAGYTIGANPSPAIPVVSGILADLISGARSEHIRYNAVRLTQAVFTGTRLVAGFPLSDQGFGLVNAAGAWAQLRRMAEADDSHNPELTSFSVARRVDGTPREVSGFHADEPRAGGTRQHELLITRHGGYAGARAYRFGLRGNDGTYTLRDREALLVQNQPVRVRFSAKARAGLHVALLQVIEAKTRVVMQEIPLSLRAPEMPKILAPGVEQYQQTIPPLRFQSLFVHVGKAVQAARYRMRIPYDGPARISSRSMPGFTYGAAGVKLVTTPPPTGEPLDSAHHVGPMEDFESLVVNSTPGTQELGWANRGGPEYATPYDPPAPTAPISGTVEVRQYALDFKPLANRTVQVTNQRASVEGNVEFYSSALTTSELKGTGAHQLATLDRPLAAHVAQWRVRVASTARARTAIDALLLHCPEMSGCELVAQRALSTHTVESLQGAPAPYEATLVLDNPDEGEWKVVVRAREKHSQPIVYTVQDAMLTALSGGPEAKITRYASGARWRVAMRATSSDALYAAFRIAGTAGREEQKEGVRVAMTALTPGAP